VDTLKVRSVSENTMSLSRKALFSTPTTLLNQLLHIPFSIQNLDIVFSETDLTFNVSTKHRSLFDNIVLKTSKVS
jgi:hypothetical protein